MSGLKDYYGGDKCARMIEELGWSRHGFLTQAFQYMFRAGNKPGCSFEEDIEKAIWFLERAIGKPKEEDSVVNVDYWEQCELH
jgi:hypothetical protein